MELVVMVGALILITALIALCTFWFFNLHRRYLVLEEIQMVQMTAEDNCYSPGSTMVNVDDSGEDRGKKLLLSTGRLDDQDSRLSGTEADGKKSRKFRLKRKAVREKMNAPGGEEWLLPAEVQERREEKGKQKQQAEDHRQRVGEGDGAVVSNRVLVSGKGEAVNEARFVLPAETLAVVWMGEPEGVTRESRNSVTEPAQQGPQSLPDFGPDETPQDKPASLRQPEEVEIVADCKKKRSKWKNRKSCALNLIPWKRLLQKFWKEEIG